MHRLQAVFAPLIRGVSFLLLFSLAGCFGDSSASRADEELEQARKAYIERRYLEAERLYERYIKLRDTGEKRWEVWNKLVEIVANVRGDTTTAGELLETMLLEYGNEPEKARDILKRIGTLYQQKRQWNKAVSAWQRLVNITDIPPEEFAFAQQQLGKAYLARSEYDLAIDSFQECVAVYPMERNGEECLYNLAQTQAMLESFSTAEEVLDTLLSRESLAPDKRSLAILLLADIKEQREDYAAARDLLESILTTYPNPQVIRTRLRYLRNK